MKYNDCHVNIIRQHHPIMPVYNLQPIAVLELHIDLYSLRNYKRYIFHNEYQSFHFILYFLQIGK